MTIHKTLLACPACDLLLRRRMLPLRRHALCPRCGHVLYGRFAFLPSHLVALTLTGFFLLPSAYGMPLLYIRLGGENSQATILQGLWLLWLEGEHFITLLAFWCAVVAPIGLLIGLSLLGSGLAKRLKIMPFCLRSVDICRHWAMLEVYLASFLVALFKLVDIAETRLGPGLASLILLMLLTLILLLLFDPEPYWAQSEVDDEA